jgi:DNA-binding NtrC family response regulator
MDLSILYKTFLTREGYNAVSFSDPLIALEYYKETHDKHSLVITDMRMPGISGIELGKKMREIDDDVKIFLMTAFDITDLKDNPDYKAARFDELIQKPVSFSELREMINNALKD